MTDKPIERSALVNLFRGTASGAGNGYDEQWRRTLEKAYLERQKGVVHSTGSPGGDGAPTADDAAVSSGLPQQRIEADLSGALFVPTAPPERSAAPPSFSVADLQVPTQASPGAERPASLPAGRDCPLTQRPQTADAEETAIGRELATRLQGSLPASSSIKLLHTEQGVHVLIRDAALDAGDVRRLLRRIRDAVAGANRRLVAVTLNGERLWEERERHDGVATVAASEQQIDRVY